MKKVMSSVIGNNQFAFTPGKQLLDCVLVANEAVHYLRSKKECGALLKIDFEKAYDCVEWDFLDLIMKNMNFGVKWRSWVRYCISTTAISVLVNGSPMRQFGMKLGLRQGCPLSPFLFNIVAEAFSVICKKALELQLFEGINIGTGEVVLSHLQFAGDTLVFCKPSTQSLLNIKRLLCCFEWASGLKINYAKSSLITIEAKPGLVEHWMEVLSCRREELPIVYLGLPLGAARNSRSL